MTYQKIKYEVNRFSKKKKYEVNSFSISHKEIFFYFFSKSLQSSVMLVPKQNCYGQSRNAFVLGCSHSTLGSELEIPR